MQNAVLAAASSGAMINLEGSMKYFLWTGMGIYIIAVLVIGYLCSRRVKDVSDFIVAGRRLPLWMATATLLATWFGAGSSMGVAASVYSGTVRDVLADPFAAGFSLILAGIFLVGILRKKKCMTVTDIIQQKFGRGPAIYASLWMIPVYIGWLGAQVLGIGVLLNILTEIDILTAQLVGAAIVLIYTATGGMWAVTLTDVLQVVLIVLGLIVILPGTISMAGGIDAVFHNPAVDYSLLPAKNVPGTFSNWVNYAGNWMIMGIGCMVGQDLLQRSLASRTPKIAISSSVMAGIFYLAIAVIPITIGLAAKILLPKWGITAEAMGSDLDNQVMPRIAIGVLGNFHPIVLVLFLSALVSAIMSSADSSLLAASSIFVRNVLQPLSPKLPDSKLLPITRIATVFMLVIATFLAMKVKSIYTLMTSSWASQLVIVFLPVVAAIYMPKASKNAVWACMLSATVVWIGYIFVCSLGIPGSLVDALSSDHIDYILTNGAVYGFAAGIVAFFSAYFGERIVTKIMPENEEE